MFDENSTPISGTICRRPQDDALHLGPRKKAYVITFHRLLRKGPDYFRLVVILTHQLAMVAILGEQYTQCAMSMH